MTVKNGTSELPKVRSLLPGIIRNTDTKVKGVTFDKPLLSGVFKDQLENKRVTGLVSDVPHAILCFPSTKPLFPIV